MSLLDHAASVAAKYEVPALMRESRAVSARVTELRDAIRGAHGHARLWSPVTFFGGAPDRHGISALESQLAEAEAAFVTIAVKLDAAIEAAGEECPPLAVAAEVEQIEHTIHPAEHPERPGNLRDVAASLVRVAGRVLRTFAPGVDLDAVIDRLVDPATRAVAMQRPLEPPRTDEKLGWAPIDANELLVRATHALVTERFDTSLASLAREHDEYETMATRLAEARSRVGVYEHLAFWSTPEVSEAVHRLLAATLREYEEAVVAAEIVLHALEQSLASYPPLAICVRSHTVLGAARSGAPVPEWCVDSTSGAVGWRPGSWNRALLLAAVVDLRRAVESAFPGVTTIATGRIPELQTREVLVPGPYRMPARLEDPAIPQVYTSEDAFFEALDAWNLRPLISRGLAHATMLGVLDHESPALVQRVGIKVDVEQVGFEEGRHAERLAARKRWHGAVVHNVGDAACTLVLQASAAEPRLMLHARIIAARNAIDAMRLEGFAQSLIGQAEALAAVESIGTFLTEHFGVGGRRQNILEDVWAALRDGFVPTPPDLVVLAYPQIIARYAEAMVPNGPPPDLASLAFAMEAVWGLYPPAHAYVLLETVFDRVAAAFVQRYTYTSGGDRRTGFRLRGQEEAAAALTAWSFGITRVFGGLPTASEVIARYVARELR